MHFKKLCHGMYLTKGKETWLDLPRQTYSLFLFHYSFLSQELYPSWKRQTALHDHYYHTKIMGRCQHLFRHIVSFHSLFCHIIRSDWMTRVGELQHVSVPCYWGRLRSARSLYFGGVKWRENATDRLHPSDVVFKCLWSVVFYQSAYQRN